MKLKFIAATLTLFLFTSCNHTVETVKVEGRYTIDIPSYLDKTEDLNKAASLQYKNAMREFYVLVIDEPKENFNKILEEGGLDFTANIDGYSKLLADDIAKSSGLAATPKMETTTINNLNARTIKFAGTVNGVNVYWIIGYVEGKNRYYQILTWTLDTKKTDNEADMNAIVESFKETDKSKSR